MMRIRGVIGDWPVDLTVELDDSDWAKLGAQLQVSEAPEASPPAKSVSQDDALWNTTKELLRKAGQLSGPELLSQLEALTAAPAQASAYWCACATAAKSKSRVVRTHRFTAGSTNP